MRGMDGAVITGLDDLCGPIVTVEESVEVVYVQVPAGMDPARAELILAHASRTVTTHA